MKILKRVSWLGLSGASVLLMVSGIFMVLGIGSMIESTLTINDDPITSICNFALRIVGLCISFVLIYLAVLVYKKLKIIEEWLDKWLS